MLFSKKARASLYPRGDSWATWLNRDEASCFRTPDDEFTDSSKYLKHYKLRVYYVNKISLSELNTFDIFKLMRIQG